MKYYLLNKEQVQHNIDINPILVKTKSLSKIKKYKTLLSKIQKLQKDIINELKASNTVISDNTINKFLENTGIEITSKEYNSMYAIPLYDEEYQRIKAYNKTNVLKGKLIGKEIILDSL